MNRGRPRKIENLFSSAAPKFSTPKGAAGYDNARENIDPFVKTTAVSSKEIYACNVYSYAYKGFNSGDPLDDVGIGMTSGNYMSLFVMDFVFMDALSFGNLVKINPNELDADFIVNYDCGSALSVDGASGITTFEGITLAEDKILTVGDYSFWSDRSSQGDALILKRTTDGYQQHTRFSIHAGCTAGSIPTLDLYSSSDPTCTSYDRFRIANTSTALLIVGQSTSAYKPLKLDASAGSTQLVLNTDTTTKFTGDNVEFENDSLSAQTLITLDQNDSDQPYFNFEGCLGTSYCLNMSDINGSGSPTTINLPNACGCDCGWSFSGMIRIAIQGNTYWMPYYASCTT